MASRGNKRDVVATTVVLLVSSSIGAILFELGARELVREMHLPTTEQLTFYRTHVPGLNHLRDIAPVSKPEELIFTEDIPFEGKQNKILVQGDSWAEGFWKFGNLRETAA